MVSKGKRKDRKQNILAELLIGQIQQKNKRENTEQREKKEYLIKSAS